MTNFNCADGFVPSNGLMQGRDGNFYGTAMNGGANGWGTVFKITPTGSLTTLHSFDHTDGAAPDGGVVQAPNGLFYGTAGIGGANQYGTVFRLGEVHECAGCRP